MELTKKQVKALLSVMSSDTTRPYICCANINKVNDQLYLTVTDGYQLASIELSENVDDLDEYYIKRQDLINWYKLAGSKDIFDEIQLRLIATKRLQGDVKYPIWSSLIPRDEIAINSMFYNTELLNNMQNLSGKPLLWKFYGDDKATVARIDQTIYLVMPLKRK